MRFPYNNVYLEQPIIPSVLGFPVSNAYIYMYVNFNCNLLQNVIEGRSFQLIMKYMTYVHVVPL